MKAFIIRLAQDKYSQEMAERCKASAPRSLDLHMFEAIDQSESRLVLSALGLRWTWPSLGARDVCPNTGLKRHSYDRNDPGARIGCALSHYMLWEKCATLDEPLMILEHDAVFLRELPALPEQFGAIMLNNPRGATPRGDWWAVEIERKGPGVHKKTAVFMDSRPDGLAGNSAYIIHPDTARRCLRLVADNGMWPNDATLCRQLVPGLMEVYPFVVQTMQTKSTTGGY